MKAMQLAGIRKFEIKEIPEPQITKDNEVKIKIKLVGVCGSDIHYYTTGRIGSQIVEYPFVVGHEAAGIVTEVGSTVTRVKPGDRIAIDPTIACGECDQCLAGREHTCRNLKFMGAPKQKEGAMREYVVLQEDCCFPIKDSMTFEQAVISEPLAIGIYSVQQSYLPENANVGILGAGPIGMSVFYSLRDQNVGNVYITDKIQDRLNFAQQLNPKWSGNPDEINIVKEINDREPLGLDVVYECTGDHNIYKQAIELLKPGGYLVIAGIPEVDDIELPIHELRRREVTVINIRRQVHCTQKALDLIDSRKLNINAMATHSFSIDETQKAFDLVANYEDSVMKAMITLD